MRDSAAGGFLKVLRACDLVSRQASLGPKLKVPPRMASTAPPALHTPSPPLQNNISVSLQRLVLTSRTSALSRSRSGRAKASMWTDTAAWIAMLRGPALQVDDSLRESSPCPAVCGKRDCCQSSVTTAVKVRQRGQVSIGGAVGGAFHVFRKPLRSIPMRCIFFAPFGLLGRWPCIPGGTCAAS